MTKYSINPYIFPRVMTIHIDSPTPNSIDLPKGANLLYLQALSDPDEKYLFRKYANCILRLNSAFFSEIQST